MIKKICFFSTCFAVHKRVRLEYAERYLPSEIKLFLLTPPNHNHYKLKRTKIVEIPGNKINFILELRKFCKENKINLLVNLGTSNESFGMFFATIGTKTKYIINEIGNVFGGLKLENKTYKKILSFIKILFLTIPFAYSKKIIYPSRDICNKNKKYFFFIKNKMKQTPLMIDEEFFSQKDKNKIRKKLDLPIKKDIILYVGRIFYLKGSDILFELIKKNPDKLFIMIGEIIDPEYEKQKHPNLLLFPSVSGKELIDYYNSADLFIFPSRVEAYGLVHREAMLCETPALVSDITALRLTKYALKARLNVEDMQKKIDEFFSMSKKERKKLGKISRKDIMETNSYGVLKNEHKDLLLN
jgi:glycosyltransferase involved in cell wall biosynthesis